MHGEWKDAKAEVGKRLTELIAERKLEQLLAATSMMAKRSADMSENGGCKSEKVTESRSENELPNRELCKNASDKWITRGSCWGALENGLREKLGDELLSPHLNFGEAEDADFAPESEQWLELLYKGRLPEHDEALPPPSYIYGKEWKELLKKSLYGYSDELEFVENIEKIDNAIVDNNGEQSNERYRVALSRVVRGADADNWYAWLQLGFMELADGNVGEAAIAATFSNRLKETAYGAYLNALIYRHRRMEEKLKNEKIKEWMLRACRMNPDDLSIVVKTVKTLHEVGNGDGSDLIELVEALPKQIRENGRIKLWLAFAKLKHGDIDEAERIMNEGGGIVVSDIREGEISVTELWYRINEARAASVGEKFDRSTAKPPRELDFRMFAN